MSHVFIPLISLTPSVLAQPPNWNPFRLNHLPNILPRKGRPNANRARKGLRGIFGPTIAKDCGDGIDQTTVDMEGGRFAWLLKEVTVTGISTGEGGDIDKECIANWGCHKRRSWGRALTATDMVMVVLVCWWSDGCWDDGSAQMAEMLRQDAGCGDRSYNRRPLVVLGWCWWLERVPWMKLRTEVVLVVLVCWWNAWTEPALGKPPSPW